MTTNMPNQGAAQGQQGGADPSMEDILASIRRILSEDDGEPASKAASPGAPAVQAVPVAAPTAAPAAPDVLTLDASMLVDDAIKPEPVAPARPAPAPAVALAPAPLAAPAPAAVSMEPARSGHGGMLLDDSAAKAAATSVGSLLRTLANAQQNMAVHRGGPTLEDLVREEMRPMLKLWLDSNLPPLVERLVRAEIERVVGRALS